MCWRTPTLCRSNDGAPGVDGQTFEDIEAYGVERWLDELAEELRDEDVSTAAGATGVHPQAGRQAAAAGDPDDQDRVVQMAAVLVLEPIFEADLQPEQYAYRPGRSALDAVSGSPRLAVSRGIRRWSTRT